MGAWRRPESVLVLVYVDRDRVLLLRRVAPFAFWQSVTGSLEPGETPAAAARRELAEETGIDGALAGTAAVASRRFTIAPEWRDRYAPGIVSNLEHEFRVRLREPGDVRLDGREHSRHAWVPIDEAIERVWSWTNKAALAALRDEL